MLPLAELQGAIRDTVLGADPYPLGAEVLDGGIGFANRLQIYRNNTQILLTDALAATYPAVQSLVGEAFFAQAARAYVCTHPPRNPCLFAYGQGFAAFLDAYGPAGELIYLSDVARLEWAANEAYFAKDARPMGAQSFHVVHPEAVGDLTLSAHPSLRLVSSSYPIRAIREAALGMTEDQVGLDQGADFVAVLRPYGEVQFLGLSEGGFRMAGALAGGLALEAAFNMALEAEPGFEPAKALAALIAGGAFSEFYPN